MKPNRTVMYLWPLIAAAAIGLYARPASATEGVVVLFDRSGSMRAPSTACTAADVGVSNPDRALCGLSNLIKGPNARLAAYNNGTITDFTIYFWEFFGGDELGPTPLDVFVSNVDTQTGVAGGLGAVNPDRALTQWSQVSNTINAAINNVGANRVQPGPSTPLAQVYCRAVTWLMCQQFTKRTIFVVTDGLQELTISAQDANCNGPSSTIQPNNNVFPTSTYLVKENTVMNVTTFTLGTSFASADQFLDVGSWMSNMLDVGTSGGQTTGACPTLPLADPGTVGLPNRRPYLIPTMAPFTPFPTCHSATGMCDVAFQVQNPQVIFNNVQFLGDFSATFAAFSSSSSSGDSLGTSSVQALAATGQPSAAEFFDGLARKSGGRLVIAGAGPTDPFGTHLVMGDVNDSGCVDATDVNLFRQSYGQLASAANPAALAADVSLDGIVNDLDYLVLRQSYGNGCPAPGPGSIPLVAQVLFGMGDVANWLPGTNAPPLSASTNSSTARSVGERSVRVGGTGYREFHTVPFNTSLFTAIGAVNKAKLQVDLLIPPNPINPFWIGQIQLLVDCPSAGINNQYIGAVELTGKTPGAFATNLSFTLPQNVKTAMGQSHNDFTIKLVVNANETGHVFDNIHFTN